MFPEISGMSPKQRDDAIRSFEWEIAEFNCACCWESKYDHDPAQLLHREHLRNLIRAIEERIAELKKKH